jgi:hypothetical protein
MRKILFASIAVLLLVSCSKSIDKYAEETLDETFKMCMDSKELGHVKYGLSDKNTVYKSDSLCIIEFRCSMFADDGMLLLKKDFEYFVSRGYKSKYRIKDGRFERKVINEVKNGRSYMYVHNEQIRFLQDDYESERIKQGKSKDEFYNDMIFIGAHIAEGNFFIEKKIE